MAHFQGSVRTEWLHHAGEDRQMLLLEAFTFVDDNGQRWEAPAGSIVDGASIPDFLWSSIIGTPFVGDYRRATVLHDVCCQDKQQPHTAVHRMFYDAMVTDGVPAARAMKMYTAVRIFGPKWVVGAARAVAGDQLAAADAAPPMTIDELEATLDAALNE